MVVIFLQVKNSWTMSGAGLTKGLAWFNLAISERCLLKEAWRFWSATAVSYLIRSLWFRSGLHGNGDSLTCSVGEYSGVSISDHFDRESTLTTPEADCKVSIFCNVQQQQQKRGKYHITKYRNDALILHKNICYYHSNTKKEEY